MAKKLIVQSPAYCSMPKMPERTFDPSVSNDRQRLIVQNSVRWPNGRILTYYFFNPSKDGSPKIWAPRSKSKAMVKQAFDIWTAVSIGISFKEVTNSKEADIRIGFDPNDGAWSYLGREIIESITNKKQRTMNLGWDEVDTATHEIGHTLGFPHEHQNPLAGIVWNEAAVIASLALPPNKWSEAVTRSNIISKIQPDAVQGSKHDADSIMHYPFEGGLIIKPEKYKDGLTPAGGLSSRDKKWVKSFYPPLKNKMLELIPTRSVALAMQPGTQKIFTFTPQVSKQYSIQTFGTMDSIITVLEQKSTGNIQIAKDDDSGTAENALVKIDLKKDKIYLINVQISAASATDLGSIMIV
jgi:Astacin (Peptidase family M12A)